MQHHFIDRYSRLESPVHALPAGLKMAIACAMVGSVLAVPVRWWVFHAVAGMLLVCAAAASRIPAGFLLRRMLLLEPLVAGVAAMALLRSDGPRVFAAMMVRATLCLATMILLANTTPFAEILRVLRRLRLPAMLITALAMMYRYLFIVIDEAQRMRRARLARTYAPGRRRQWRLLATVVGGLFVRCTGRAERIYAAMRARGWQ